ncbi:MAG: MerR family transcriptional regulator [Chitinispirillaceae bacterium]|nr:MerR family transcriptional regulator [Chitinispirillaceae bacterium]
MENSNEGGSDMITAGKIYYSISEVCGQIGVEPHVLRYWESEFPQLRPKKNRAGNRAYRDKDIEIVKTIRHLLYEDGFTIPGAKKKLAASRGSPLEVEQTALDPGASPAGGLGEVKKELKEILSLLKA